ncbi:hypothetical protein T4B_13151 [Trichinella pseudospiralis]|uniref:Uncharacterized protein n=1 Tax=Trichinella pseudospiralis TaxID=6337 RepID=A0A0V1JG46_TRIPS|nr:hypothetical protein T4B_13151 [Trichinella pseudospiralis]KRZ42572.1 hypothetical protein T4C_1217 [Trichinella pseudospiralis]
MSRSETNVSQIMDQVHIPSVTAVSIDRTKMAFIASDHANVTPACPERKRDHQDHHQGTAI